MKGGNVLLTLYNLFVCINMHCEKVERAPHCQSSVCIALCSRFALYKKKEKEKKKYCILIVTWVLLREINKY